MAILNYLGLSQTISKANLGYFGLFISVYLSLSWVFSSYRRILLSFIFKLSKFLCIRVHLLALLNICFINLIFQLWLYWPIFLHKICVFSIQDKSKALQKGTPFMERQPPLKGDPLILKLIYSNLALFLSKGKPLKKWNSFNFLTKNMPFCSCIVPCNIYAKAPPIVLSFMLSVYLSFHLFKGEKPQKIYGVPLSQEGAFL